MSILKFAREYGLRVVKCRYCKDLVIATSPCQKVCKRIGCQKKRQAEKQKRYNDKIRKQKNAWLYTIYMVKFNYQKTGRGKMKNLKEILQKRLQNFLKDEIKSYAKINRLKDRLFELKKLEEAKEKEFKIFDNIFSGKINF